MPEQRRRYSGEGAYLGSVGLDAVLIHRLQHGAAAGAADGVPAVRVEVQPLRQRLRNLRRGHHRRQGQAIPDALRIRNPESNAASAFHRRSHCETS